MWQNLRAWRKSQGLTLVQVARRLDVTHSTVLRWERGEQTVPTAQIMRLAEIYGCTPAELEYDPTERARGKVVHDAIVLAQSMTEEQARAWLAAGEMMVAQKK